MTVPTVVAVVSAPEKNTNGGLPAKLRALNRHTEGCISSHDWGEGTLDWVREVGEGLSPTDVGGLCCEQVSSTEDTLDSSKA